MELLFADIHLQFAGMDLLLADSYLQIAHIMKILAVPFSSISILSSLNADSRKTHPASPGLLKDMAEAPLSRGELPDSVLSAFKDSFVMEKNFKELSTKFILVFPFF
jgi:hypothetical protein